MTVQMLRVKGWSSDSYWYAGKAGEVFRLLGTDLAAGEWITREPSGYVNIIKFTDAELVDVAPAAPSCTAPDSPDLESSARERLASDVSSSETPLTYRVVLEVTPVHPDMMPELVAEGLALHARTALWRFCRSRGLPAKVELA